MVFLPRIPFIISKTNQIVSLGRRVCVGSEHLAVLQVCVFVTRNSVSTSVAQCALTEVDMW